MIMIGKDRFDCIIDLKFIEYCLNFFHISMKKVKQS